MPLAFRDDEVRLRGNCGAEDALELAEWLAQGRRAKADLTECEHLHAALVQTLIAFRTQVTGLPNDAFLARWIVPALNCANGAHAGGGS